MNARLDDFGIDVLLTDRPPKRRVDWTEPPAEGDHLLVTTIAGDDE